MDINSRLKTPEIQDFCIRNSIRKLSLFGSYLSGRQKPDSDLDLLVEFEEKFVPSLIDISRMEIELSSLLDGIKIDLRTAEDLSKYFRQSVLNSAEVQYARL